MNLRPIPPRILASEYPVFIPNKQTRRRQARSADSRTRKASGVVPSSFVPLSEPEVDRELRIAGTRANRVSDNKGEGPILTNRESPNQPFAKRNLPHQSSATVVAPEITDAGRHRLPRLIGSTCRPRDPSARIIGDDPVDGRINIHRDNNPALTTTPAEPAGTGQECRDQGLEGRSPGKHARSVETPSLRGNPRSPPLPTARNLVPSGTRFRPLQPPAAPAHPPPLNGRSRVTTVTRNGPFAPAPPSPPWAPVCGRAAEDFTRPRGRSDPRATATDRTPPVHC